MRSSYSSKNGQPYGISGNDIVYVVLFIVLTAVVLGILIVLVLEYCNNATLFTSNVPAITSNSKDVTIPTNKSDTLSTINPATELYADTHKATVLVLGCIDYRLIDYLVNNMMERYDQHFDLVVLAGSELFVVDSSYKYFPSFSVTFFENVQIAIKLHHIQRVVAVSHEDCGAYKVKYGDDDDKQRHVDNLELLGNMIKDKYTLPFDGHYLSLDGTMEQVVLVE